MKKEWKPEELRQTSEEIRGATLAKSITPEMVGGTLSGLTEALAEVVDVLGEIPRCHVTVKVEATDGTRPSSAEGATVYVDAFCAGGIPTLIYPRQELDVNENCEVEFDIPVGCKFAVYSKLAGYGASSQFVYEATYDSRRITLQHFPVGIWWVKALWAIREDDNEYGELRLLTFSNYVTGLGSEAVKSKLSAGESFYDSAGNGLIVSTPETSFMIPEDCTLSEEQIVWCKDKDYNNEFVTLPGVWFDKGKGETYIDAQNKSRQDWNGNLNTAKILAHASDAPAALWCASQIPWNQSFLPSEGQLVLMQENRNAINAIMTEANAKGRGYKLLPYQNADGRWQLPNGRYECWGSSTRSTRGRSWTFRYDGVVDDFDCSDHPNDVRAVSAFYFEY